MNTTTAAPTVEAEDHVLLPSSDRVVLTALFPIHQPSPDGMCQPILLLLLLLQLDFFRLLHALRFQLIFCYPIKNNHVFSVSYFPWTI